MHDYESPGKFPVTREKDDKIGDSGENSHIHSSFSLYLCKLSISIYLSSYLLYFYPSLCLCNLVIKADPEA